MKVKHLPKYTELLRLLWKYGTSDVFKKAQHATESGDAEASELSDLHPSPEDLAKDFESLGPTFIKIGQILSTRPDLLPDPYLEALSRLQDNLEPIPFEEVETTVQEELGVRISKAFQSFEAKPLASASLGQVHWAVLRDGREVAVKVQRPGIRQRILEDLEALEEAAVFLEKNSETVRRIELSGLVQQFRKVLLSELDYRTEARNLQTLAKNLEDFDLIVVPLPVESYTSGKVLTMDFVKGYKVTKITPLRRLEMDGEALVEQFYKAYLKQLVNDGFMHADPHPGNVHLTDDNRLALIDLGMVVRFNREIQEKYLQLLLAIADGKASEAADVVLSIAKRHEDADEQAFRSAIAASVVEQQGATIGEMKLGKMVLQLIRGAAAYGFVMPYELNLVGKALLNLDQIGKSLAPKFDPNQAIRRHAAELMQRHLWKSLSPANLFSSLLETKRLVETLPDKMNKILSKVADNELEVRLKSIDEKYLMEGFQKIANRITLGLILASLVVGAALLMQVKTTFTIIGYPGLAMLFFLIAAVGVLALAYQILFYDDTAKRKPTSAKK